MLRWSGLADAVVVTLVLAASACGSSSGRPTAVPLTVFAAASLTEAFDDLQAGLRVPGPGLSPTYSFGGSGALVTQIRQGAPADVVATADPTSMKTLSDAGLVEAPRIFARNKLEILVAPGNPKGIHALTDLSRPDLTVVTEDDSVPAGRYGLQALRAAGVTLRPVSEETDVKAAVARVTSGEVDATIVYATDVTTAGPKGQGVEIPDAFNVVAEYPIAVVKSTGHRAAAAAFVDLVVGGSGQDALRRRGFRSPT